MQMESNQTDIYTHKVLIAAFIYFMLRHDKKFTFSEQFQKSKNNGTQWRKSKNIVTAYQRQEAQGLEPRAQGQQVASVDQPSTINHQPSSFVTLKDTIESPDGEGRIHKDTKEPLTLVKLTAEQVEKSGGNLVLKGTDIVVESRSFKMSKSRGNVINPDDVVKEYGADSLRLYEMFMGPLEATKPWSMSGVEGVFRFLARVWRLVMEENADGEWLPSAALQEVPMDKTTAKVVHATIKKVGEDIEALSFNTAISQMMICTNALTALNPRPAEAVRLLLRILGPFAPHLAEELWARTGGSGLVSDETWPAYDPALLIEDEIEMPVQVNGKLREKIVVKKDATQPEIEAIAKAAPKVAEAIAGKEIKKLIVVPGRLVNIVVG